MSEDGTLDNAVTCGVKGCSEQRGGCGSLCMGHEGTITPSIHGAPKGAP